jgi:4-amino-4-deoxy-L-arabinose transferase-like glycosyltransferase
MTPAAKRSRSSATPRAKVAQAVRDWGLMLALAAFATAWNLTKAYHIDDTAYLETAQWIAAHPLHPMSGTLFWGEGGTEPIHHINQPVLYPYAMTAWGSLFGWSEVALHSLMALCALAAIVLMHRIARAVAPDRALLATALVAASPAFVVGQNTLVDVPALALWLAFFALLLAGREERGRERARYLAAGLVCGAAILVKYPSLVLLPALALDGLLRRRSAAWYGVAGAAAVVLAWCAFNEWDYGGIHMLTRIAGRGGWYVLDPRKWLLCLGSAAPFAFALGAAWLARRSGLLARAAAAVLLAAMLAVLGVIVASCRGAVRPEVSDVAFVTLFIGSGALLIVLAVLALPRPRASMPADMIAKWLLACWAAGAAAFIVLFAPFIAMRHVLLALPPIVLLALMAIPAGSRAPWNAVALVTTFASTSVVASADRWYAGIYRDEAARLRAALPASATVWTTGHWGWQWYARQNGMRQLVPGESRAAPGDFIVYPENVHHPPLPPDLVTTDLRDVEIAPASWVQAFASPNAGFYATSTFGQLPYAVRWGPIEVFRVLRVEATHER